jgi:hypothetical protein
MGAAIATTFKRGRGNAWHRNPEGCAAGVRLPAADVVASGLRCQALPRIAGGVFTAT